MLIMTSEVQLSMEPEYYKLLSWLVFIAVVIALLNRIKAFCFCVVYCSPIEMRACLNGFNSTVYPIQRFQFDGMTYSTVSSRQYNLFNVMTCLSDPTSDRSRLMSLDLTDVISKCFISTAKPIQRVKFSVMSYPIISRWHGNLFNVVSC